MKWKIIFQRHLHGLLFSYSQIFFARSLWFGALLLITSMLHPVIGVSGLLAVIITNAVAESFTMNPLSIREGLYGFCSALVGMGMGAFYHMSWIFLLVLFLISILCLLVTIVFQGFLAKYQLPFMGFPFLVSFWVLLLSAKYFANLSLITAESYPFLQEFLNFRDGFNDLNLPEFLLSFCRSLGAVFFQSNVLVGMCIAIGLFLYSRISFSLAVLGFSSAFLFYKIAGIDTRDLVQYFVGANYIFIAIAIGGFFVVANTWSYTTVIFLVPIVALIHYGSTEVLSVFHLPAFTLSLAITTLFYLYLLKWRTDGNYIHAVQLQYSSPEKNLYHYLVTKDNYRFAKYFPISLPFWGEWLVSQAHNGKITHLGEWSKAFDFVLTDDEMKTFYPPGDRVENYYCYNKPVLSPGEGTVEIVVDNIEDNVIFEVNTKENWGNSMVINHGNAIYSQLSHLKSGDFKYKTGDFVKRGEIVGLCGNSGRSPEPHIHFQVQNTAKVGSQTMDYPIASYILRKGSFFDLKIFEKPNEGDLIRNPEINPLLKNAFNFVPGKSMRWYWKGRFEDWTIYTDEWNRINIWCAATKSIARLENDGVICRFNFFEGDRNSILYHFYLSCYKVFLGFYSELIVRENYPVLFKTNILVQWLEDITAPFFHAVKSEFAIEYFFADDLQYTTRMELRSVSASKLAGIKLNKLNYVIHISTRGFEEIEILEGEKKTVAVCVSQ
ncbi:MAG: urea transporter [Bacteroidia bacterium]|nr:urea transporter [Bacteroidia bacterium]